VTDEWLAALRSRFADAQIGTRTAAYVGPLNEGAQAWAVVEGLAPTVDAARAVPEAERACATHAAGIGVDPVVVAAVGAMTRCDGQLSPRADWLMPISFDVPHEEIAELESWYDTEHVPMLLTCPDWLRVRRFTVEDCSGANWNRFLLHDLSSVDVFETPEVRAALETPWRATFVSRPWFTEAERAVLRRSGEAPDGDRAQAPGEEGEAN
jgi:hypothetical protein